MSPVVDRYVNDCTRYWLLFPLTGIAVKDVEDDFSAPCFGDATLLSVEWIKQRAQEMLRDHSDETLLSATLLTQHTDALIAVRWELSEVGASPVSLGQDSGPAENRANEISSLLTLYEVLKSDFKRSAGLTSRLSTRQERNVALSDNQKSLHCIYEPRDHIDFFRNKEVINRSELLRELKSSALAPVFAILKFPKHQHVNDECRAALASAVKHLAAGLYVNEHNEVVANSVSCFDILLKSKSGAIERQIKRRLRVLTCSSNRQIISIYHARNNWIHEGKPVSASTAKNAVKFAINSIISFAHLLFEMPEGSDRSELLKLLDLKLQNESNYSTQEERLLTLE